MRRISTIWLIPFALISMMGCARKAVIPGVEEINLKVAETQGTEESRKVLVVCNIESEESIAVTEYYASHRDIPPKNICQIQVTLGETITMSSYRWDIARRIKDYIRDNDLEIEYIVMTKGVPIRINNTWGLSVDSCIVGMPLDLDPVETGSRAPEAAEIRDMGNPYYGSEERFSFDKYHMYLVSRLDGYTVDEVKRLITRSIKAQPLKGKFFFDRTPSKARNYGEAKDLNEGLSIAASGLKLSGFDAEVDTSDAFIAPKEKLMGYVSWGSNDSSFSEKTYHALRFEAGSIAETFVSTSGRSFQSQAEGQSMIADLISQGATAVKGYVSEPWTLALCRPSILVDRYTRGFNAVESFYAASPVIMWKDIVIADPLLNPYEKPKG